MVSETPVNRLVSHKIRVVDLLRGKFIKMEGWEPNYVLTENEKRVSRLNLLGTVVSVAPERGIAGIDDGTGMINLRFFGEPAMPEGLSIGQIVNVIGKVRQYNDEIYILPETIRVLQDMRWFDVRKLELLKQDLEETGTEGLQSHPGKEKGENLAVAEEAKNIGEMQTDGAVGQPEEPDAVSPAQKIYELIKKMDSGKGADIDDVKEKSGIDAGLFDKVLRTLMEQGEIFEARTGKYKVLQ